MHRMRVRFWRVGTGQAIRLSGVKGILKSRDIVKVTNALVKCAHCVMGRRICSLAILCSDQCTLHCITTLRRDCHVTGIWDNLEAGCFGFTPYNQRIFVMTASVAGIMSVRPLKTV